MGLCSGIFFILAHEDTLLDATGDLEADLNAGALPLNPCRVSNAVSGLRNRRRLLSVQWKEIRTTREEKFARPEGLEPPTF